VRPHEMATEWPIDTAGGLFYNLAGVRQSSGGMLIMRRDRFADKGIYGLDCQ